MKYSFQLALTLSAVCACVNVPLVAHGQTRATTVSSTSHDSSRTSEILARVYIECDACDRDYLQQELTFVSLVRDRLLADVVVFVTSLEAASGGRVHSVQFLALRHRPALGDTLLVNIRPDATSIEEREALVRTIKVGVLPFVRGTFDLTHLSVRYEPPARKPANGATRDDPWNQWVFRVEGSGSFSSDDNNSERSGYGRMAASRITALQKIELSASGSVSRETFRLEDNSTIASIRQNWAVRSLFVHSINDHWSAGTRASVASSIFENTSRDARLLGAVEYDLFPYRDATQRQLIARYSVGVRSAAYVDTTIYGRIRETRPFHDVAIASDIRRPWGNIYGNAVWSQYLHSLNRNRVSVSGGVDYRILAGLNTNFNINYSRIRDQLSIRGKDLTDQERLLQLRELQSGYSFSVYVGVSYTFGSVFSNVVNPRFRL